MLFIVSEISRLDILAESNGSLSGLFGKTS
jgi:hypothetical protein